MAVQKFVAMDNVDGIKFAFNSLGQYLAIAGNDSIFDILSLGDVDGTVEYSNKNKHDEFLFQRGG